MVMQKRKSMIESCVRIKIIINIRWYKTPPMLKRGRYS